MSTIYDWVTLAMFAGLIVLFLERSSHDEPPDTIWHYLPPSVGCALANYCGNKGSLVDPAQSWTWDAAAVLVIAAVCAYVYFVLKPRFPGGKDTHG